MGTKTNTCKTFKLNLVAFDRLTKCRNPQFYCTHKPKKVDFIIMRSIWQRINKIINLDDLHLRFSKWFLCLAENRPFAGQKTTAIRLTRKHGLLSGKVGKIPCDQLLDRKSSKHETKLKLTIEREFPKVQSSLNLASNSLL